MVAYDASINQALLPEQNDLKDHKEHCSADPEKLATVGRLRGHQVRIKRNDDEYALFTVSEVRQENQDNVLRMGKCGRERLGTSDEFVGTLDAQVVNATLADSDAKCRSEFVERLDNHGMPTPLIVIAPHGGISRRTPTSRPSTSRRSWRGRESAHGGARAGGSLVALLPIGTSPPPISTRRAFPLSTRSSLGASNTPSPSMGSTTTKFR